jgi:DNA helicase-2/ATP-dependent DNA helicase PcrA
VTNCYNYIEKNTVYSTKHGVKGAEFDNVLVIVDDNAWRNFNDNEVFSNNTNNTTRYDRSRNLLYVCCSRPKKKLVLYAITSMSKEAQNTIIKWFGENNVYY